MAQKRIQWTGVETAAAEPKPAKAPPQLKLLTKRQWTGRRFSKAYLFAKRTFDIASSACLLAVIWPVLFALALAIKMDSKGPAVYRHKRVGQNGKPFLLYKFRSMVADAEDCVAHFTPEQKREWEENYKLVDDPRTTRIGTILRKTGMDELPQLLNILQGSLSVVGPRPVIEDELDKYGENKGKFLSVKPGLTGYWQAYARSGCTYRQRMEMELFYVDNANFRWDMQIIKETLWTILYKRSAM